MRKWTCVRFDEFKATDRLPTPPGVALALLRLTASANGNVQKIATVLETDPALVGRAIKLANSALLGAKRPVASAREAVVRLGTHAVSNLALGFWLVSQTRGLACKRFDYGRYWQHSLAVAAAAKAISARFGGISPDEAFTCGLLSQVGRLAIATVYPDLYSEILARCERDGEELLPQLEREQFAIDNTELTVALLEDWGLPGEYGEAVLFQSLATPPRPDGPRAECLANALDFGLGLARACLASESEREKHLRVCLLRAEKQGINSAAVVKLADRAMAELRHWGDVLQVPMPEAASFADLAGLPATPLLVVTDATQTQEMSEPPWETPELAEDPIPRSDVSDANHSGQRTRSTLRILVVAEDVDLQQNLTTMLAAAGHSVSVAASREGALPAMLKASPQVLIVDGLGVGGDGNALCRHLRQARLGRDLYVLGLTDSSTESVLDGIAEAGADDFLVKPINPFALTARLRAGQRIISLQEDAQRDREEMRRFAAELAVANRRLHHAAYEDALTQLPNRRCAIERLTQEWARNTRNGLPMACILGDIDHFKRINDTFGHDGGDAVLQATAEVLRGTVRAGDLACRLGGEEFLILGLDTDLQGARICAERLCAQVARNRVKLAHHEVAVTISLGVAARASNMHSAEDLLKKADQAVYLAKQTGRNRVCVSE